MIRKINIFESRESRFESRSIEEKKTYSYEIDNIAKIRMKRMKEEFIYQINELINAFYFQ